MEHLDKKFSESESNLSTISTSRHGTQSSNSVRKYSDPIPIDLLIDIFSLVPANSIARFRCVSKFWRSILQRLDFTELFLTKSSTRPRLLFAFKLDEKIIFYSSPQPQNPHENSSVIATRYHTLSFPNFYVPHMPSGLVLLLLNNNNERNIVICNPATGESLTLPDVQTSLTLPDVQTMIKRIYVGYDPINKQFKVLCVTSSNTYLVLTLETGTLLWRMIECEFHHKWYPNINNDVCINGVIYFGSLVQESPMIVCFEVGSEKFGFIEVEEDMLENCYDGLWGQYTLVNYKGKLGVYELPNWYKQTSQIVLWVLEDAGENKWSKHVYKLTPRGKEIVDRNVDVGMTDAGEIVFASCDRYSEHFYLYYYSLESNTFTRVNFHGLKEFEDHNHLPSRFLNYVENMKLL